ncbi:MAG: hypothetical protein M3409_11455 [Gemmatimonadota bacterium]|jgi:hypothetical protein|nr:hypothetical protein [Gemmatimonadota bacterium]
MERVRIGGAELNASRIGRGTREMGEREWTLDADTLHDIGRILHAMLPEPEPASLRKRS